MTEKQKRTRTKLISDLQELYRFLVTPEVGVANLMFASDSVVWASWRYTAEEQVATLPHITMLFALSWLVEVDYICFLNEKDIKSELCIATQKVLYLFRRTANRL